MELQIGSTIGGYKVIKVLGAGGMGKVYLARNPIANRLEAIKVLLPDPDGSQESSDRFQREIQVQASLQHPNIAALHHAMPFDDQILMVMEFVEGDTLGNEVAKGALPPLKAVECINQVLSALSYAHGRGVIHRDIKPSNMMLRSDGVVKLMDFGIAKAASDQRLTQTGLAIGSIYYMSPEQIQGSPLIDGRADLYSTGISLYELVTGKRPFQGDSQFAVMAGHLESQPTPPIVLNPLITPDLNNVILKSLAKDPNARFQAADEFQQALQEAMAEKKPLPTPLLPPPPRPKSPAFSTMTLLVAGLALISLSAKLLWQPRPAPATAVRTPEPIPSPVIVAPPKRPEPQQYPAPAVQLFSASPSSVQPGQSVLLHWKVSDATGLTIKGIGSQLPCQGSHAVSLDSSRTFQLTATGPGGVVSRSLPVNVAAPPSPPVVIEAFTVNPATIHSGQTAHLSWKVSGAKEVSIDGIGHKLAPRDDRSICPATSTSYTLHAKSPRGTLSRTVNLDVSVPSGANVKLVRFEGTPLAVDAGGSAVLRWQVENAAKVWIDGVGPVDACGEKSVTPQLTTKYQLFYQNDRGTLRSRAVEITVR